MRRNMLPSLPSLSSLPSLRSIALALAVMLVSTQASHADDDPSIAAFGALKKDVEALRKDTAKKQFRHNYEKLIVRLQATANTYKEGSKADDAAFVAAQLLEELSYVSRLPADRTAAVDAFVSCADRFPSSNLADDSLLAAARLHTDNVKAKALLERVIAMSDADLKDEAKKALAALKPAALSSEAQAALAKIEAPSSALPTGTSPVATTERVAKKMTPVEVLPEAPAAGTPARKVIVIKHAKTPSESIVTLRVSGDVGITRGEVPVSEGGARRIFFDLAPARLGQRNIQPIDVNDGIIARVRAGQYDTEVVRLVVELEGDAEPALQIDKKPFEIRLVSALEPPPVDVVAGALATPKGAKADAKVAAVAPGAGVDANASAKAKAVDAKAEAKAVKEKFAGGKPGGVSISQQLGLRVHRVVIDAGHGGNDTGAIGPSGIKEKDVTLQIAKRVKEKLLGEFPTSRSS